MTRDEAIARLKEGAPFSAIYVKEWEDALQMAIEALEEPERKKGKWIEREDLTISGTCSCCGWNAVLYETDVVGMPYCPNCGADMREEKTDEV